MDEARRQVLMLEYEDARRERANLDAYIEVLAKRLGLAEEDGATPGAAPSNGAQATQATGPLPTGDPIALVYDGEFIGMSWPKASAEVLSRWSPEPNHRPLKTPVLLAALQKGGLTVETPRQLYRSLYNSSRFVAIKGGKWGFASWYPDLVKSKAGKSSGGAEVLEEDANGLPSSNAEGTSTGGAVS